ncbi:MAG: hypothetical protein CMJ65_16450 [Planctomycetaceae bacterium]|nr:hypothetical protein [Planctomycetaceae bacterium]
MTEPAPPIDTAPRRSKRRRLFVAICLIGIPLSLSGLDHLVGWILATPPRHLLFPSGSRVQHESCEFDVVVTISSQGLRDRDFSPLPPATKRRVVAIGDSFTFGWGVRAEESWPKVVENLANEPWEVINFGFPGASPNDYSPMITAALDHFSPSIVLVGTLQGDDLIQLVEQEPAEINWSVRTREWVFPTLSGWLQPTPTTMESYRSVFRKSQAYLRSTLTPSQQRRYRQLSPRVRTAFEAGLLNPSLVHTAMTNPGRFVQPVQGATEWRSNAESRFRRSVREWSSRCRAAGARLVMVIVPDGPYVSEASRQGMRLVGYDVPATLLKTTVCQEVVTDICSEFDVAVIDPVAGFREAAADGDYFELDGHFTPQGHKRLAAAVIREIGEKKQSD